MVLGLLLSGNVFAKTINIENKILLNVPENFSYIKLEAEFTLSVLICSELATITLIKA